MIAWRMLHFYFKMISVGSLYSYSSRFTFHKLASQIIISSNADISTAGLQPSSGQTSEHNISTAHTLDVLMSD